MKKILIFIGVLLVIFLFRYKIAGFIASQNTNLLLEYYQYLLKENPDEAYKVCIDNFTNNNSSMILTSYDKLDEMYIPDIMIFYAQKESAFSMEQMNNIYDLIAKNLDKYRNLKGVLSVNLYDNTKNPALKYYPFMKKEILKMTENPTESNSIYFDYFSNYRKSEDSILLKNYIAKAIYQHKNSYNFTIDNIIENPKKEYFPILKEYYQKEILEKTFRSDQTYFELEQFTLVLIKYPNMESKKMLNEIAFNTNYSFKMSFDSSKEQIYLLLKNNDKLNYFSEVKEKLEKKLDNNNLQKIIKWNRRWKRD